MLEMIFKFFYFNRLIVSELLILNTTRIKSLMIIDLEDTEVTYYYNL